jgi:hypothetical protein
MTNIRTRFNAFVDGFIMGWWSVRHVDGQRKGESCQLEKEAND